MAKAEVKERRVIESIMLELSIEEAVVLKTILGNVAGDARNTLRIHTDEMWEALHEVGMFSLTDGSSTYQPFDGDVPDICFKRDSHVELKRILKERGYDC